MKQYIIKSATLVVLWLASMLSLHANWWLIATMKHGMEMPEVDMYYGKIEKAPNGTEYLRIYDCDLNDPKPGHIKLPYGYRFADKQIYIFNFETGEEKLGFDFRLEAGERFTTYNGMEWVVEDARDTLVNRSLCGKGECVSKRLLTVRSADGKRTDRWLEDFGSFTNHFMIYGMENWIWGETLWMEYFDGEYDAREINADPFFAHDTGWLEGKGWDDYDENEEKYSGCTYKDGTVTFENKEWWYEHRAYTCYYRKGDDIYRFYATTFFPLIEGGKKVLCEDVATFKGLPEPASGQYVVHTANGDYATGIHQVIAPAPTAPDALYDLQGRRLAKKPAKGIYINNGKKKMAE